MPLAEAKGKLSELVDRVSRGEEFIFTRHDKEIAQLVPVKRSVLTEVGEAIVQMRAGRTVRRSTAAESHAAAAVHGLVRSHRWTLYDAA